MPVRSIGFSPADDPKRKAKLSSQFANSLAGARNFIAEAKGDARTSLADINTGPHGIFAIVIDTTPRIFLSFNDADSPANIAASAAKLTMPLLWIAGDNDPTQTDGTYAFDEAPANPFNRYVTVHATHLDVPDAGAATALAWLAGLRR
jgi:pimeloyl-ACP methyl ester carboxylesterase